MTKNSSKQNSRNNKKIQKSMFWDLKGKIKPFTRKEREEIMGDDDRFN